MRYKTVFRVNVGSVLIVANWYIIDPSCNVLMKSVFSAKEIINQQRELIEQQKCNGSYTSDGSSIQNI